MEKREKREGVGVGGGVGITPQRDTAKRLGPSINSLCINTNTHTHTRTQMSLFLCFSFSFSVSLALSCCLSLFSFLSMSLGLDLYCQHMNSSTLQRTATHCNTLQRCLDLGFIVPPCHHIKGNSLHHTAPHLNTLRRIATHCNVVWAW